MITLADILSFLKITVPAWVTATTYAVDDVVTQGGAYYVCAIAHTSSVFNTDLAASKWIAYTHHQDCIDMAIGEANRATNRGLTSANFTEYYDGTGTDQIYLKNYPVTGLTSIKERDSDGVLTSIFTSPDTIADAFIFDGGLIKLMKGYTFPKGTLNVQIAGTAGYTSATVPADLAKALIMNAAMIFYLAPAGQTFFMKSSANLGGQSSAGYSIDLEGTRKYINETYEAYRKVNI